MQHQTIINNSEVGATLKTLRKKMKTIKIYQLRGYNKAKFKPLSMVKAQMIMPRIEDYKLVWQGQVMDNAGLDDIYRAFNTIHPKDYKGHSLSMSDIVCMNDEYYYCDFGWKDVTEMFPLPSLKKGEKYECIVDYVMEDGDVAYKAGNIYEMVSDVDLKDEEGYERHRMSEERDFFIHFKKIS